MLQLLIWKGLNTQMIIQLGVRETVKALLNVFLFLKTGLFKEEEEEEEGGLGLEGCKFLTGFISNPEKSLATKVREHLTRNTLSYCWPVLEEENGLQHISRVAAAHCK